MLDLFETKELFRLVKTSDQLENGRIRLAAFSQVEKRIENKSTILHNDNQIQHFNSQYNLILYCQDYRLHLYQYGFWEFNTISQRSGKPVAEWRQPEMIIPVDCRKGHIVAMCLDRSGSKLLSVTSKSFIYIFPLELSNLQPNNEIRFEIEQDATVIEPRIGYTLKNEPTTIVWWERDTRYKLERNSVAFVGSRSGEISMVDLETGQEFYRYSISPFCIERLEIYDELCNRSLLITCSDGQQYQQILEEFRNSQQQNSCKLNLQAAFEEANATSQNSLLSNINNYYLSYVLDLPFNNEQGIHEKTSELSSNQNAKNSFKNIFFKPQLITFNNEIDLIASENLGFNISSSFSQTKADFLEENVSRIADELFFSLSDGDLLANSSTRNQKPKESKPNMHIHLQSNCNSQCKNLSKNIHVLKFMSAKIRLNQTVASTSIYQQETTGNDSSNSCDEMSSTSVQSDDSSSNDSSFVMVNRKMLKSPTTKFDSPDSDFCNISITREQSLEVYEFQWEKFCTKAIILSSAKPYIIPLMNYDVMPDFRLVRMLDLGDRFLLLVFNDQCLVVAKAFSEQTKQACSSAPRSPLLLKRSDSTGQRQRFTNSNTGSFRKKNISPSSTNTVDKSCNQYSMSVVDKLELFNLDAKDQIIEAFLLKPGLNGLGIREYIQQKFVFDSNVKNLNQEQNLISLLSSDDLDQYVTQLDEQCLIITQRAVYLFHSKQNSFGKFFHQEIQKHFNGENDSNLNFNSQSNLISEDNSKWQDGELIRKAKFMVDCMGHWSRSGVNYTNSPKHHSPLSANITIPISQPWQLWLCRSALRLMHSIYQQPILVQLSQLEQTRILSLGDLNDYIIAEQWLERYMRQIYRLMELSRSSRRRTITALNYFRFWSKAADQIEKFFQTRTRTEMNDDERRYLADQMFEARLSIYEFCQQLRSTDSKKKIKISLNCLYNYFYEYRQYYDSIAIIDKLISKDLLEMAEYVALLNGDYLHLIHFLLRKFCPMKTEDDNFRSLKDGIQKKIFNLLFNPSVTYSLILSTDYLDYDQFGCRSISLIELYLKFIFAILPQLNQRKYLQQLSNVLDPRRLPVRLLLNQTLFYCNQTYLCQMEENNEEKKYANGLSASAESEIENSMTMTTMDDLNSTLTLNSLDTSLISSTGNCRKTLLPLKRRDLINLYLFVQLLLMKNTRQKSKFNRERKRITKQIDDIFDSWNHLELFEAFLSEHMNLYDLFMKEHFSSAETMSSLNVNQQQNYKHWHLAAGSYCSLIHDHDQFLLWGTFDYHFSNYELFQQKFSSCNSPNSDYYPQQATRMARATKRLKQPTLNRFFSSVIASPIRMISIGHNHMMILTDHGLYALGSGSHGQLGLGPQILAAKYPSMLDFSCQIEIIKVVCGSFHTLILDENGRMYSFGWAIHGQLGHGFVEDIYYPKLIDYFCKIQVYISDMAAGYSHTVVLAKTGDLYVFGHNYYGQMGMQPERIKFSIPEKFNLFNETNSSMVRLICCGSFHTAVIASHVDGNDSCEKLFLWGMDPKTWRLKMRSDRSASTVSSTTGNNEYSKVREIKLDRFQEGGRVMKMSAGHSHTLLLTDKGQIYAFGYGKEGQLTVPSKPTARSGFMPQTMEGVIPIIDNNVQFTDIACGANHSLALDHNGNVWGWGQTSHYQLTSINSFDEHHNPSDNTKEIDDFMTVTVSDQNKQHSANATIQQFSLVNQVRLSSPRTSRWSPLIILSLKQLKNQPEKNLNLDNFIHLKVPDISEDNEKSMTQSERLCKQILLTILYHQHDINFRSLIKRIEHLKLYELCSFTSWLLDDLVGSLQYHLEALYQDFTQQPTFIKRQLLQECSKLLIFFLRKISERSQRAQSELTFKMLKCFCNFFLDRLLPAELSANKLFEPSDFSEILENVYLCNEEPEMLNPYFGLHLLCFVKQHPESETIRHRLSLDDQIMLRLVNKTEWIIKQKCDSCDHGSHAVENPITTIQELFQKALDFEALFQCSQLTAASNNNKSKNALQPSTKSLIFPIEVKWMDMVQRFNHQFEHLKMLKNRQSGNDFKDDQNDEKLIEMNVPSDVEENDDDELALIFVFKCGHYYSWKTLIDKFQNLFSPCDYNKEKINKYDYQMFQKVVLFAKRREMNANDDEQATNQSKIIIEELSEQIKNLNCIDCYMTDNVDK